MKTKDGRDLTKKTLPVSLEDMGDRRILFKISDGTQDRDEDVMVAMGCDLTNFDKNPQFLGFHDYGNFPFGKPEKTWKTADAVYSVVWFPMLSDLATDPQFATEHAKLIDMMYHMYRLKILNAVSVGFDPKQTKPNENSASGYGRLILEWELYEFSGVPVPSNPNALAQAVKAGKMTVQLAKEMEAIMIKGAIAFHSYPLAEEDTAWDGPAEVSAADPDDLKKMCAWYDAENPDVKSSYKLPHHEKDGYKTVWKGVAAAMGVVLGARGGVNIPEGDLEAVKAHLAKHYKEFGKDVPDGKSAWEVQWKQDFPENKKDGRRISAATQAILDKIAGHHEDMKDAMDLMVKAHKGMADCMKDLIGQDEPDDDGDDDEDDQAGDGSKAVLRIV